LASLDEVDGKILEILRKDARITNDDIARQVGLTEGAVRNRIKRLVQNETIKKFTIETEHHQAEAVVLIKTETKASKDVLKKIRKFSSRLFETAGHLDVAAFIEAESIGEINRTVDRLRAIAGVASTITLIKIADERLLD